MSHAKKRFGVIGGRTQGNEQPGRAPVRLDDIQDSRVTFILVPDLEQSEVVARVAKGIEHAAQSLH